MFKFYRKSQEVQLNWIRNHPVQYIVLNAIVCAILFGYWEYKNRQETRALENKIVQ